MELQMHGLFGVRDTIQEATEYFEDVQLYVCEDCLTIQKRRRNGKRISL